MTESYIELFQSYASAIQAPCGKVLNEPRMAALEAMKKYGFPDAHSEEYRQCEVSELLQLDYGLNVRRLPLPMDPREVFNCDVPNLSSRPYFVFNDAFYLDSMPAVLPAGVLCGSLNQLTQTHPDLLEPFYNALARQSSDGLVAFNSAFVQDGFVLYVPKQVQLEKPVQLIQIMKGSEDMMCHRRLLVILEAGAKASLLVCDHSLLPHQYLINQVTELFLGEGAALEFYELEMSHEKTARIAHTLVDSKKGSQLQVNGVTLRNGFTRHNMQVSINGEGASANLSGIVLGEQSQTTDYWVSVEHVAANCTSKQLYKYLLEDQAKGVFTGKIKVQKGAKKTAAYQLNKNLCSRNARMYSRPQLEIYTDDVQCGHGSATGQMDEEALFYIRSRGISEKEAKLLLKLAFTSDIIDQISLKPLRDRMRALIEKRFRGELAQCASCSIANCQ